MAITNSRQQVRPDVRIIVCTDEYGCRRWYHRGRAADDVLKELHDAVDPLDDSRVQVTTAGCILGCTFGPRLDVVRRWSGEKVLYGSISGAATVTRRGRVNFAAIPDDLEQMVADNLPETAIPTEVINAGSRSTNLNLLRQILLDCSRGINGGGMGLNEAVVIVHNEAASVSIPSTLSNLEMVDGNGQVAESGDIAVLVTDGDGRVALQLSRIRQLEFLRRTFENGMPSYAIWLRDGDLETVYRIYLRRSDDEDSNPLRHALFMALVEKYGSVVNLEEE